LDLFLAKIEEWIDRSKGKIRADVCYEKLVALGCGGSDREREQQHSQGQQWRHQEFELGPCTSVLAKGRTKRLAISCTVSTIAMIRPVIRISLIEPRSDVDRGAAASAPCSYRSIVAAVRNRPDVAPTSQLRINPRVSAQNRAPAATSKSSGRAMK
jgi:hypothetical protein